MKIFLVKLIKAGNGSIPNWFRFDFLSHFLLSSFSIDFGSTIDRNQSTLIEVINSMSAEKSKSIEIDRNQIVPSLPVRHFSGQPVNWAFRSSVLYVKGYVITYQ